jgi:ABC-2 type transport system ATP-binding protein
MLDYQVASLSRGMRQRIGLARTLLHGPDVLILDEPAGGLDPNARIEMRKTIQRLRDLGKTILLSSHILPELASVCELVGILKKGRLVAQGTVAEIVETLREELVLVIGVDANVPKAVKCCLDFPNVEQAVASGNEIRLVLKGTRSQIADLNTVLVHNGIRVNRLREEEVDLERVFLTVTDDTTPADDGKTTAAGPAPAAGVSVPPPPAGAPKFRMPQILKRAPAVKPPPNVRVKGPPVLRRPDE